MCPCACVYVYTRIHVPVRSGGCSTACLCASTLGCAARQDVEPSATQPGDHPRVHTGRTPALLLLFSCSFVPRNPATSYDISFAALDGMILERDRTRLRPRANILRRGPSYPPVTTRTPYHGFVLQLKCSFARIARTFSQVNNIYETRCLVQMFIDPFCAERSTVIKS